MPAWGSNCGLADSAGSATYMYMRMCQAAVLRIWDYVMGAMILDGVIAAECYIGYEEQPSSLQVGGESTCNQMMHESLG